MLVYSLRIREKMSKESILGWNSETEKSLLLLLLLLLSSSSSSSPLCRVFILILLRQIISLGNTVLQLFCCYCSGCLYRYFQCWIYFIFTLVLSEVCVQCPIWLYYYYYYYYYYYHHHHHHHHHHHYLVSKVSSIKS